MTKFEIDAWAIRAVTRLLDGQAKEDSLVEFKAELPPPKQAARWIAGHANAARGETILWIIGIDEDARRFSGLPPGELSDWWAQVQSVFDETAPSVQDQIVDVRDGAVHALAFDCNRLPFVIKNQAGGQIDREVPWREGTSTRSARRSNLIEILAPVAHLPRVDMLRGTFSSAQANNVAYLGNANAVLYVVPHPHERAVFAHHDMKIGWEQEGRAHWFVDVTADIPEPIAALGLPAKKVPSSRIIESSSELVINGPGKIRLQAAEGILEGAFAHLPLNLCVQLTEAFSRKSVFLSLPLRLASGSGALWIGEFNG